jgi:hypothetical protein
LIQRDEWGDEEVCNKWSDSRPRPRLRLHRSSGPGENARLFTTKKPRLHAVFNAKNVSKLELKLPEQRRYCFGGVLAGAAGLVAGFTGALVGVLPAAGAGTPD